MKKKRRETSVEIQFLGSLSLLLASLILCLFVLLKFRRPTLSHQKEFVSVSLAEKKSSETKKQAPIVKVSQTQNDSVASASSLSKQKTLSEKETKDLVSKAMELVNQAQTEEAKAIFEKVLKDDPEHEEALTQLALIYLLDYKDEKSAQPYFEKILSVNPENKTALAELVDIYANRGDGVGVKYLESLYEKNPNNSIALGIGQVLIETNPRAAIPYLEKAGDSALNELVEAHLQSGNYERAYENLQRQEELLMNKMQSIEGEHSEYLKDELLRVKMSMNQVQAKMKLQ